MTDLTSLPLGERRVAYKFCANGIFAIKNSVL